MLQRRFIALVIAATVGVTACGSSSESDSPNGAATVDGDVVAVGSAPVPADGGGGSGDGGGGGGGGGGIGGALEVAVGALDDADAAACTADRQALEAATESYEILNGTLPTSQQELLDAQMIREVSMRFEITAEGDIVVAPGSPCS